jgi:hypothetical protein
MSNVRPHMTNHQRVGAISNAHVGREFEAEARAYFSQAEGLELQAGFAVPIGVASLKKAHSFDLGFEAPPIIVECKSHNWTETGNMPSAKMTVWNEAMYYFQLAPSSFRKVLFVLEARHPRQKETLAEYYVRLSSHLIPSGVAILEFNPLTRAGRYVHSGA